MLSLGLLNSPFFSVEFEDSRSVHTNLLKLKINVFKFVHDSIFRPSFIFPKLNFKSILEINNSKNSNIGPVNCAADDLDLSLTGSNDQIEFFDDFINFSHAATSQNPSKLAVQNHSNQPPVAKSQFENFSIQNNDLWSYDLNPNSDLYSPASSLVQSHPHHPLISTSYDQENYVVDQFNNVSPVSRPVNFYPTSMGPPQPNMSSHFSLNMIGLNAPTYFNDFKQSLDSNLEQASIDLSSSESYISPLDDELFKKFNSAASSTPSTNSSSSRKRKFENDTTFLNDMLVQNQQYSSPMSNQEISFNKQSIQLPSSNNSALSKNIRSTSIPTPQTTTVDPYAARSSSLSKVNTISYNKKARTSSTISTSIDEDGMPGLRFYECQHCQAKFKVKSYLTRHLKKHNTWKAFVCPFYQEPIINSQGNAINQGTKCHPTGGFSRRDTYKTHLKALHFIYPPGTKSNERNSISGRCAGCFQYFENNLKWLEDHIEGKNCTGTVLNKKHACPPPSFDEDLSEVKLKEEIID